MVDPGGPLSNGETKMKRKLFPQAVLKFAVLALLNYSQFATSARPNRVSFAVLASPLPWPLSGLKVAAETNVPESKTFA